MTILRNVICSFLNILLVPVIIVSSASLALAADYGDHVRLTKDQAFRWQFRITEGKYRPEDAQRGVQNELGRGYRVADWNDVKAAWRVSRGPLSYLFEGKSVFVTVNGNGYFGERIYHIADHNGRLPNGWLAHDQLGGHQLDLGSWTGPYQVLAVREGVYFHDLFKITYREYRPENASNGVKSEFGSQYRVADWHDVKRNWRQYRSELSELFEGKSVFVTFGGQGYNGQRIYHIADHNGVLPSGWLAHDQLGGHELDLGSWKGPYRVLAILEN